MMRRLVAFLALLAPAMADLGQDPMYLMNNIGNSLGMVMGGGEPMVLGAVIAVVVGYLMFAYKADRGVMALLSVLFIGTFVMLNTLPTTVWFGLILIIGAVAAFGALNALRQGEV